ncbi:MAG TPA: BamA/TamA family outer membrane protein [Terracidiphilus sp.]|nr:BamA/TamA family outer membrane protein [Terracidiphilus sp.]
MVLALAMCAAPTTEAEEPRLATAPIAVRYELQTAETGQANAQTALEAAKGSPSRGSFVFAPIPTSSPAIGYGATIIGAYIFPLRKSDTVSPPSVVAGAWAGTDNGTRGWVAAGEFFFDQNRYHIVSGYAHGDVNYYYYGTGTAEGNAGHKFGLNQTGDVFIGEALRRTFWQIFIGPRVWFGASTLEPQHVGETPPELPPLGVDFKMRSVGFKVERDTRPNRFYPQEGSLFRLASDFFAKDLGSTFTFQRYRMTFNSYTSFGKKQVLAVNVFGCSTGGDAPFFGQCIFGTQDELRGYPAGRYIDRTMFATQAEYRRVLPWRLGLAVFGGVGEVAPSWSSYDAENLLPSVGVGPRFVLSRKYHVNLRGDFAWGKNGNTFSMGMGESF